MLSLGKLAAGPQAAAYYTQQVAQGRDDYYSGAGEEPGRWIGAGAQRIGWTGEVDAGHFASLLAGAGLRRPPREGAVAGFDLTFSAPKSVSVLWAVAGKEVAGELRAGHDQAVADALGYLEREACRARRGHGGAIQVRGGGFVGAAFMHRTSRAGDPQLHTHVVVGNLTHGPDDRWTALDARHLYRQAKTAGYLYQAVLRRELAERLGLEWTPVKRGVADLAAVPRGVIEHFSQRREEVLDHMAAHGGRSAASAEIAALETRRGKEHVPLARQHELWRSRAAEHGLTQLALVSALRRKVRELPLPAPVTPKALTEHDSAFGRPDVLRAIAEAQPLGARVEDLEQLADATIDDHEVIALEDGVVSAGLNEPRYSTRELLAIEHRLVAGALQRRDSEAGTVSDDAIGEACAGRRLSAEQRRMVDRLCGEAGGVAVVRAAAGTGKTYALDAAREAWEVGGSPVHGCALSARAALELSDQAGIEAVTIARLTGQVERGYKLPKGSVLIVDEAGMVGTRDLAKLADAAERAQAKLVLVGDDKQLPEIHAGGAFRRLADELEAVELHDVQRQREAWDREALRELRGGDVERWARIYRERGRITIAENAEQTRAALVNDWAVHGGEDCVMIAARREDVRDLNERARQFCQSRGDVSRDELKVGGRSFAVGDRVVGTRNDRPAAILNGQRGIVTAIHPEREALEVRLDGGKDIELGASYLRPGHLDHGYAITAHRAQGMTVGQSFVLGSQDLYRELGYTALSRHRDQARFYVARSDVKVTPRDLPPDADPVVSRVARLLERSEQKDMAIESLPQVDVDQLKKEREALREQLAEDVPEHRLPHVEEQDIARHEAQLADARKRERRIRDAQEQTPWWQRRDHRELEHMAKLAREDQAGQERAVRDAVAERDANNKTESAWVREHRREIQRLVAVEQELSLRGEVDRDVSDRLAAYDRELVDRMSRLDPDVAQRMPDLDRPFVRDLETRQVACRDLDPLDAHAVETDDLDPYRRRHPRPGPGREGPELDVEPPDYGMPGP